MKKKAYACVLFFAIVWALYGRKRVFVTDVKKMRTLPGGRFRGSGATGTSLYRPFGEAADYSPEEQAKKRYTTSGPHETQEGLYMGHMGTAGGGY